MCWVLFGIVTMTVGLVTLITPLGWTSLQTMRMLWETDAWSSLSSLFLHGIWFPIGVGVLFLILPGKWRSWCRAVVLACAIATLAIVLGVAREWGISAF